MEEIFAGLLYDLHSEQVREHEVNEAFLFGEKTSGVGWWHMAFGRVVALRFFASVAAKAMVSEDCKKAMGALHPGWARSARCSKFLLVLKKLMF